MGNCQAIDAATLVIQHPSGKVEKFYVPVSASHVMKTNPGHYVALLISTTLQCPTKEAPTCAKKSDNNVNPVRLTRIKLLKPTDTLVLGQVYRLITTQEVMKGLREKQKTRTRHNNSQSAPKQDREKEKMGLEKEKEARRSHMEDNQVDDKRERNNGGGGTAKSRLWQPSLQSISESAS